MDEKTFVGMQGCLCVCVCVCVRLVFSRSRRPLCGCDMIPVNKDVQGSGGVCVCVSVFLVMESPVCVYIHKAYTTKQTLIYM